jgi:hypothetical protein
MVCECRVAVNDLAPHTPAKRPYLYWANNRSSALKALIDRCNVSTA